MSEQTIVGRPGLVMGLAFCGRPVVPEWALGLASLNWPANMNLSITAVKGQEVGEARCTMAKRALELGARYLFFLDDDVAPPYFAARKLIYDLEQADEDVMVAGGIYVNKQNPPEPMVFQEDGNGPFWKWKAGDVFPVKGMGTGCMMIKTEVFKHLPEPWFMTVTDRPAAVTEDIWKYAITDDLYFCRKVREAGFKLIADGGIMCVHWDVENYRAYTLPEDSYPLRGLQLTEATAVAGD